MANRLTRSPAAPRTAVVQARPSTSRSQPLVPSVVRDLFIRKPTEASPSQTSFDLLPVKPVAESSRSGETSQVSSLSSSPSTSAAPSDAGSPSSQEPEENAYDGEAEYEEPSYERRYDEESAEIYEGDPETAEVAYEDEDQEQLTKYMVMGATHVGEVSLTVDKPVAFMTPIYKEALDVLLNALVQVNLICLKKSEYPPLYKSGVRYVRELSMPDWANKPVERWKTIPFVFRDQMGDCEDLSCWLVAENLSRGIRCKPKQIKMQAPSGILQLHIVVEYPNGRIEDPSKVLGM